MANLEGACYVLGYIAPGLRSSRLLLESEPLLRSVLVFLYEDYSSAHLRLCLAGAIS